MLQTSGPFQASGSFLLFIYIINEGRPYLPTVSFVVEEGSSDVEMRDMLATCR